MKTQLIKITALCAIAVLSSSMVTAQDRGKVGINIKEPTHTLDVNGTTRVRSLEKSTSYKGEKILTVDSIGVLHTTEKDNIIPPLNKPGSVISDGEKLLVGQEIGALMSRDFVISSANTPEVIDAVDKKIVDNENKLNNGVFQVTAQGHYQIIINAQVNTTNNANNPIIGLWDGTKGSWVAKVTDSYTAPTTATGFQTYTLFITTPLSPGIDYSFRIAISAGTATVKALNSGSTGTGNASSFSVKRVR